MESFLRTKVVCVVLAFWLSFHVMPQLNLSYSSPIPSNLQEEKGVQGTGPPSHLNIFKSPQPYGYLFSIIENNDEKYKDPYERLLL